MTNWEVSGDRSVLLVSKISKARRGLFNLSTTALSVTSFPADVVSIIKSIASPSPDYDILAMKFFFLDFFRGDRY